MLLNIFHTEKVHKLRGLYLGDLVFGANDGIITTFAVVSGATGAVLSSGVIIILGLANLFADGISMGVSNYLSLRSKYDYQKRQRGIEEYEVEKFPEKEKEEVRVILRNWGIVENKIEETLHSIIKNKKRWIDIMMREELNIIEEKIKSPVKHGIATSIGFFIAGSLPLIPYLFGVSQESRFLISIIATALSLFMVGSLRTIVTKAPWFRSGIEMFLVGGLSAIAAYIVGFGVKSFFGISV